MGCSGCTVSDNGSPNGCQSNGGCSTGGCNRLNTYDWLATMEISEPNAYEIIEVSFKNGARKSFFHNQPHIRAITGDMVVVETGNGYDIGRVSLSGELVRMQMRKKNVDEKSLMHKVVRIANERDLERLDEARRLEKSSMIRARAIARTLDLDMKVGDVEYQGDKRKATFYYTADGRVDFRELIRHFAKEFRVKIEMRQIGARQESARIGGIGSCGRELCCSTWLTEFKSVSTAAARYQNLAINQAKLSGQCGRLKCCLNYELDTYMDALGRFPKNVDKLKTEAGTASLIKTDIFQGIMFYCYDGPDRSKIYPLAVERVKEIKAANVRGEFPPDLMDLNALIEEEAVLDFNDDVTGFIELPPEERRKRKKRRNRGKSRQGARTDAPANKKPAPKKEDRSGEKKPAPKEGGDRTTSSNNARRNNRRGRGGRNRNNSNNKNSGNNNNSNNKNDKPKG